MEVRLRWRGRDLYVSASSSWTIGQLRQHVQTLTNIPAAKQRYLWRVRIKRGGIQDTSLLRDVIKDDGKAVMLIGEPLKKSDEHSRMVKEGGDGVEVVDDLWEIEESAELGNGGTAFGYRDVEKVGYEGEDDSVDNVEHDHIPGLVGWSSDDEEEGIRQVVEAVRDGEDGMREDVMTLEGIGSALSGACVGKDYAEVIGDSELSYLKVRSFTEALREARRQLKMLTVLITNVGGPGSGRLFEPRRELGGGNVVEYLNESMLVFPVDLLRLGERGSQFLRRLGLHDSPAMIVLSESNTGMMVVDLFAIEFVVGTTGLLPRLLGLFETYDGFYQDARARREVTAQRAQEIAEQDEAFQQGLREDTRAEEERMQRENEERQRQLDVAEATNRLQAIEEPSSSEGGVDIRIMIPNGSRISRRFKPCQALGALFDLCVANGVRKGRFVLNSRFPPKTFTLERDSQDSLESALAVGQALLFVEMLDTQ